MRIGSRGQPFYRVVAVDERKKRTGQYLELLGTYNPLTEPKEIKLDQTKIDAWIKKGAQLSDGFLRITGKAPQRPPRKPKKQKQESSDMNQGVKTEELKQSEEAAPIVEQVQETPETQTTSKSPENAGNELKPEGINAEEKQN